MTVTVYKEDRNFIKETEIIAGIKESETFTSFTNLLKYIRGQYRLAKVIKAYIVINTNLYK